MPLYYFDTNNGDHHHRDEEGVELADDAAARGLAQSTLPNMASDTLPNGEQRAFTVLVRDANEALLYSACLTLTGQWHDGRLS